MEACFERECEDDTEEIQEQKPMDRIETHDIATSLNYRPPLTTSGTPYMLSIDQHVKKRLVGGGIVWIPGTCKPRFDKLTDRDHQLLEIAEVYWSRRGQSLVHIDETYPNKNRVRKWAIIRAHRRLDGIRGIDGTNLAALSEVIGSAVGAGLAVRVARFWDDLDKKRALPPGTAKRVFFHLLAVRAIRADLTREEALADYVIADFQVSHRAR